MNIKLILIFCTTFCLFITLQRANGQDKSKDWPPKKFPHDPKNCFHLLSNSYQCNWIFWGVKGNMEGTIVAYDTIPSAKKGPEVAAVSIVKFGRDTVRVLFMNTVQHKPGDIVKVAQGTEPELDVLVPFDRDFFISEENKGHKPQCRINEYDSRVFKTTWGKIAGKPVAATPKPAKPIHAAGKK